jgi:transposase
MMGRNERKRARKHRGVATKAVAHKLGRACYHMLHEGTTFDFTRAFG